MKELAKILDKYGAYSRSLEHDIFRLFDVKIEICKCNNDKVISSIYPLVCEDCGKVIIKELKLGTKVWYKQTELSNSFGEIIEVLKNSYKIKETETGEVIEVDKITGIKKVI